MRIVSLLPSATELICCVGLEKSLVGVTHECDFPPQVAGLPKVTRTLIPTDASSREIDQLVRERMAGRRALYSLDLPRLQELQPDLIVTQSLCDVCAVAEAEVTAAACTLPSVCDVLNLEPVRLDDVLKSLRQLAERTKTLAQAETAIGRLQARIDRVVERSLRVVRRPRVVVLEWIDPPFSSGHWTPELVQMAGGDEQLARPGMRSRTLAWQEVVDAQPDALIIACCGFSTERTLADLPLLQSFPHWADLPAVRSRQVFIVDGNAYFSRPGPRLVESLELIAHALHPSIHDAPAGIPPALRL